MEGFEKPLTADSRSNWSVKKAENGSQARVVRDVSHSGRQSLLLEQTTPVTFPPEAYNAPSYDDFHKKANNGKGSGHVTVEQEVPVQVGKSYSLRFYYRAEDLHEEIKTPAKDRGYAGFECILHWRGHVEHQLADIWVADQKASTDLWKEVHNDRRNYYKAPKPYVAPRRRHFGPDHAGTHNPGR